MAIIAVVDAGAGNLRSVVRALQFTAPEADVRVCDSPRQLAAAERIVLPGQGALRDCMGQLQRSGMVPALREAARSKPLLGVCVGLQMLFTRGEEAPDVPGLDLFPGEVPRFRGPAFDAPQPDGAPALKVPHMGWNRVRQTRRHALWSGIPDGAHFYFVHSYYVRPADTALTAARTAYGIDFTCAVAADNIFATQFHPEKSAEAGLQLYRNFVHWTP